MLQINNRLLESKIEQLVKSIEIVGGNVSNKELLNKNAITEYIIEAILKDDNTMLNILDSKYSIMDLLNIKTSYEKKYLLSKNKIMDKITYKIKEYNTKLQSDVKKFKANNSIELYNSIKNEVQRKYYIHINELILMELKVDFSNYTFDETEVFYGEYLKEKREDFVLRILNKLGI